MLTSIVVQGSDSSAQSTRASDSQTLEPSVRQEPAGVQSDLTMGGEGEHFGRFSSKISPTHSSPFESSSPLHIAVQQSFPRFTSRAVSRLNHQLHSTSACLQAEPSDARRLDDQQDYRCSARNYVSEPEAPSARQSHSTSMGFTAARPSQTSSATIITVGLQHSNHHPSLQEQDPTLSDHVSLVREDSTAAAVVAAVFRTDHELESSPTAVRTDADEWFCKVYSRLDLDRRGRESDSFSGDESADESSGGCSCSNCPRCRNSCPCKLKKISSHEQLRQLQDIDDNVNKSTLGPQVGSQDPLVLLGNNTSNSRRDTKEGTEKAASDDVESNLRSKLDKSDFETDDSTTAAVELQWQKGGSNSRLERNGGKNGSRKTDVQNLRNKKSFHMLASSNCNLNNIVVNSISSRRAQHDVVENEDSDSPEPSSRSLGSPSRNDHSMSKYFNALQGPELEVLKNSAEWHLPSNDKKWPFLLRFPIAAFGIALGLGSQTILWKSLSTEEVRVSESSTKSAHRLLFLHIPSIAHILLWCVALLALLTISVIYFLKCVYYLEAVRREFEHPVRVNFFFAPWIAFMFLTLGIPTAFLPSSSGISPALWCTPMAPMLLLELKIYGEWLSAGSKRKLSKVANPTTHLSIVGNFVLAILAVQVGWKEAGVFFWSVGWSFYAVLFVTLYQRLPTNESLPLDLHPVYFLFVAAPSNASLAWADITGEFGYLTKVIFFFALFQYALLVVRAKFFFGFRFSVAWWAYTFPVTAAAVTSVQYYHEERRAFLEVLAGVLSLISMVTMGSILCATLLHAFVWKSLFPNDMAIGIHDIKRKKSVLSLGSTQKSMIHLSQGLSLPISSLSSSRGLSKG